MGAGSPFSDLSFSQSRSPHQFDRMILNKKRQELEKITHSRTTNKCYFGASCGRRSATFCEKVSSKNRLNVAFKHVLFSILKIPDILKTIKTNMHCPLPLQHPGLLSCKQLLINDLGIGMILIV